MVATGLRVLVTAVIDSRNRGPKVSAWQMLAPAGESRRRVSATRRGDKTPCQVVLLPPDPLLSDLKAAATKCFQDLYVVLTKFKVKTVVGFETLKDASRLGPKRVAGARVEVHGEGADLESEFEAPGRSRSVGGAVRVRNVGRRRRADDRVRRVRGVDAHTRCVGISDAQGTPRKWTCGECNAGAENHGESGGGTGQAGPPKQPPAERVRPPPTVRRPLPERIMPRRKGVR